MRQIHIITRTVKDYLTLVQCSRHAGRGRERMAVGVYSVEIMSRTLSVREDGAA